VNETSESSGPCRASRAAPQTVLLLGDSILDNQPYTGGAPDTTTHLRSMLGTPWRVELLARDGATLSDIPGQLRRVPTRDAVAFLSVGGNDLTQHIGLLARTGTTAGAILGELLQIADHFTARYDKVAQAVAAAVERTVLCTIYEVRLEPEEAAELARVPLGVLNDRIVRVAARLGLEVLELRDVCTSHSDFVLEIEPSAQGARKIADAIADLVRRRRELRTARIHSAFRQERSTSWR
jgi:lysophospholipase L1-like esterase